MKKYCGEVVPLGPFHSPYLFWAKLINRFLRPFGQRVSTSHLLPSSKYYAKVIGKRVERDNFDLLFFASSSDLLAFLNISDIPKVYFTDATFKAMNGYYQLFSNLIPISCKWGNDIEQRAINQADLLICPSHWVAQSVVEDYGGISDKIHVLHCGANLQAFPERDEVFALQSKRQKTLNMLFVGGDWQRKGGDVAIDTMIKLNNRGIDARLIVCGDIPQGYGKHKNIISVGFLDRNDPHEFAKFHQLYKDASVLFLPVRSECFGLVYAEASAYGLPIVSTATGGVPDYVDHLSNGYLLPEGSGAASYADRIESLWTDRQKYREFSRKSREKYEKELNWELWGKKMQVLLLKLVSEK
jgi:glycosyltransferase involved in cell wall biosynthesis